MRLKRFLLAVTASGVTLLLAAVVAEVYLLAIQHGQNPGERRNRR